jgi:hypothetical protein
VDNLLTVRLMYSRRDGLISGGMHEGEDEMLCHFDGPSLETLFGPGWPIVRTLVLPWWKRGLRRRNPLRDTFIPAVSLEISRRVRSP